MNLQIMIQRECVCCGGTDTTNLYFDGSKEAKTPHNSDCSCGCTLELSVIGVADLDKEDPIELIEE